MSRLMSLLGSQENRPHGCKSRENRPHGRPWPPLAPWCLVRPLALDSSCKFIYNSFDMKKNSITQHIQMSLLRRIIYPLLFLVLVLFILVRQPMLEYFVIGDADAFAPLSGPAETLTYIRTNAVDLFYTGDDYYVNGTLTGHYYYQLSDGYCRIYILKPSTGRPAEAHIGAMTVSGKLVKNPEGRETLIKDLAEALDWTYDGLASVTDPYFVNQVVYFPLQEKILFGIVTLGLGLIFWTSPYLYSSHAALYLKLKGRR